MLPRCTLTSFPSAFAVRFPGWLCGFHPRFPHALSLSFPLPACFHSMFMCRNQNLLFIRFSIENNSVGTLLSFILNLLVIPVFN